MSAWVGQYEQLKRFCLWTKVHQMFYPTWKGLLSIKCSSDLRCVDPFRRYSRSKSEVVRNRAEFWTFFALPNFREPPIQKLYPFYHPCSFNVFYACFLMLFYKSKKNMFFYVFYSKINVFIIYDHRNPRWDKHKEVGDKV